MNQAEENLYKKVKSDICRMIFNGIYQEGDLIPPERKLSEELKVSRVTVRKALKLLEEERIISRIQGSGTRVSMHYGAREGNMEIITLVASAQNEFFARFMDVFQTEADRRDSLVLFKQKPGNISLRRCLYQIYEKGIRNVVLWPESMQPDEEMFRVLKGLGLNMVLFDTVEGGRYADAVCLDNADAIRKLHTQLSRSGCRKIGYIGWDEMSIGSQRVREETFRTLEPEGRICSIPYQYRSRLHMLPEELILSTLEFVRSCDGIIYAVGEIGAVFERYLKKKRPYGCKQAEEVFAEENEEESHMMHKAGMIDTVPGIEDLGIYTVEQDFEQMAERIFHCLHLQNRAGSGWKAADYHIEGRRLFREL